MRPALLTSLFLTGACPLLAAETPPLAAAVAPAGLAPSLRAVLDAATLTPEAIDTVFNETILREGQVDPVVAQLNAFASDSANPVVTRAHALLLVSHLQWRFGRSGPGGAAVDQALALQRTAESVLHKARLTEAGGDLPEAKRWYEEALALAADPAQKEELQLRLTFLTTSADNIDALLALAQGRDRAFRNRAAVALALLNHPGEAVDLYEVSGDETQQQRQHVRLAQWALQAGRAAKAQEEAWSAVIATEVGREIRYALQLLVEAHELDRTPEKLLARLASRPDLGRDARDVQITLLRQLGRFDDAISLLEENRTEGLDAGDQRRLLRLYSEAGKSTAMVSEFRQLMAQEPAETTWPRGLSEYYLQLGQRAEVERLWRDFLARNTRPEVLLAGGEVMSQLGLHELALAAADRSLEVDPDSTRRVMWYRFDLYLKRGDTAKVEQVLAQLDQSLPADSPERPDVADGYERIKNPRRALAVWEGLMASGAKVGLDEKTRIAWLYDTVGQPDKAMEVWWKMWESEVPDTRRRLVEDRVLVLGARTAKLGDIALQLEQRIAAGTAKPQDSAFLTRIYTEAGDTASAIEIIREQHRRGDKSPATEIASLREQAKVYQALGRPEAFIQLTEQLRQLDPANRIDYIQSLILIRLERNSPADQAAVQVLLTALREDTASANDEFEAGILTMARLPNKAIDVYRRALARNPAHSDNYLLLIELLQQSRRTAEGYAILQYFAEIAPADDAFLVAIDGVLNLKPSADAPVVRWAQRRVLERITQNDGKFYLYELAAEVADAATDTTAYLAALENSLVDAGPRRSAVLRELITATGEKGGRPQPASDQNRNLTYSRRLIALGEEMPPEVYLNAGRTFLRMGRPAEALEAFNTAIDRTQRDSLVVDAADRFEAAGYDAEAKVLYEKALTGDVDNVAVIAKLARVSGRAGVPAQAAELYLRAVLALAGQELVEAEVQKAASPSPFARGNPETDGLSYLAKENFTALQSGLLYVLPAMETDVALPATLREIEQAFDRALREVVARTNGRISRPLDNFPRLNLLAMLARRVGINTGRREFADRLDAQLLKQFGHDAKVVGKIIDERVGAGWRDSATQLSRTEALPAKLRAELQAKVGVVPPPSADLAVAAQDALAKQFYNRAVSFALAARQPDLAYRAYQEWINAVRQPEPAVNPADLMAARRRAPRSLIEIVEDAEDKLDRARYLALCGEIAAMAAANPADARSLLTGQARGGPEGVPSVLERLEAAVGRRIFTPEQATVALAALTPVELRGLDFNVVLATVPAKEAAGVFGRYTAGMQYYESDQLVRALRSLLARELDAAAQQRMVEDTKVFLQKAAKQPMMQRSFPQIMRQLGPNRDVTRAGNEPLLERLNQLLAETAGEGFSKSWLAPAGTETRPAGQRLADAIMADLQQAEQNSAVPAMYRRSTALYYYRRQSAEDYPKYKAEIVASLEARLGDKALDKTAFLAASSAFEADAAGDPRELTAWLERVAVRFPQEAAPLENLAALYRRTGETKRAQAMMERLVQLAPSNESYRQQLATFWQASDHPENLRAVLNGRRLATAVATDDMAIMLSRSGFPNGTEVYAGQLNGTDPVKAAAGLRSILQGPTGGGNNGMMMAMMIGSGGGGQSLAGFNNLRTVGQVLDRQAANEPIPAGAWLEKLSAASGEPAGFLDRLIAQPFALPELVRCWQAAAPNAVVDGSGQSLLRLLGRAYVAAGQLEPEFTRLSAVVASGRAGRKEVALWLELAALRPREQAAVVIPVAEKALRDTGSPSAYQGLQLARLYARAGRTEEAINLYTVLQVTNNGGDDALGYYYPGSEPPAYSAVRLAEDAGRHFDRTGFGRFLTAFGEFTRPAAGEVKQTWHRRFRLRLGELALQHGLPPEQAKALVAPFAPKDGRREDLIRAATVHVKLGAMDQSLAAFRLALQQTKLSVSSGLPDYYFSSGRQTAAERMANAYSRGLGLDSTGPGPAVNGELPRAALDFKELFAAASGPWLDQAAAAIPAWLQAGEIEVNVAGQVLALAVWRQQQLGLPGTAASAPALVAMLARPEMSRSTATIAVLVAQRAGAAIPTKTAEELINGRRLAVELIAGFLQQIASQGEVAPALALGEAALTYTQNESLLRELESLAARAGDPARAAKFQALRQRAAAARTLLAAAPAGITPTT